jgi:hypothetical protein
MQVKGKEIYNDNLLIQFYGCYSHLRKAEFLL